MKIITVSREFGSGGRELGKRLADILKFDYYDSEIVTTLSKKSGLDKKYIEDTLNDHGWQNIPITFRSTFNSAYLQSNKINLLIEQKKVIEEIASLGKDFVIVGRNADVILQKYSPFNIFVCADTSSKLNRCINRAPEGENLTEKQLLRKMKQIDASRRNMLQIISGSEWGNPANYNLTVNTTGWQIKQLADSVACFAKNWFERSL